MYGTMPQVKRLLNPKPTGTIASGIFIGTSGSANCGTTFAIQCINDAGTFIDGMINHRYTVPFSTIPGEIKWIANRLAAAYIIQACKMYTAVSASNYLYDKEQTYFQEAMTKLQALADGIEKLASAKNVEFPQGEHTTGDKREFSVPGSANVRPDANS